MQEENDIFLCSNCPSDHKSSATYYCSRCKMFYCSEDCWNGAHDEYSTLLHPQLNTNDLMVKMQILEHKLIECQKLFTEIRTDVTKSKPFLSDTSPNMQEIPKKNYKKETDNLSKILVEESTQDSDHFGSRHHEYTSPIDTLHHPPIHNYLHDDDILASHSHEPVSVDVVSSDQEVIKKRARPTKEEKEEEVLPRKKKLRDKSPKKRSNRPLMDRRKKNVISSDEESPQKPEKRKSGRGSRNGRSKRRDDEKIVEKSDAPVPGKRKRGRPPKVPKVEPLQQLVEVVAVEKKVLEVSDSE